MNCMYVVFTLSVQKDRPAEIWLICWCMLGGGYMLFADTYFSSREVDILNIFSSTSTVETTFMNSCFTFLHTNPLLKRRLLLKENIYSQGGRVFFPFRVDTISEGSVTFKGGQNGPRVISHLTKFQLGWGLTVSIYWDSYNVRVVLR